MFPTQMVHVFLYFLIILYMMDLRYLIVRSIVKYAFFISSPLSYSFVPLAKMHSIYSVLLVLAQK